MNAAKKQELRVFAEALFSDERGPAPDERLDWLCDEIEAFVTEAGPRTRVVLEAGLFVSTWLAPVAIGQRPPLARLSLEDRWRALEKMESTKAGLAILGIKAIVCIHYYEHPDALSEIGADVRCLRPNDGESERVPS